MRVCLALLLAAVALSLALPPELAPWTTGLRDVMFGWCPLLPVLVALCLALSGRLLPAAQSPVPDVDHTGLTVGLLRNRRLLLAALERVWPGRVVDVLARIPVAQRDPVDLRHARMHGYAE